MNSRTHTMRQSGIAISVMTVLALSWSMRGLAQNAPPPLPDQEQPEVLTRGPVHEAFAEPVDLEFQAGVVATIQPPANIAEIPPAERPAGDHFVWVPGYWSWDGDRKGYIWVSACWRVAPPDMSWVPGYWNGVAGGWEWVAGFWTPAGAAEVEYLAAPPAFDSVAPPGPPPSADQIWVPPVQYWNQDQYIPRPGYWLAAQPGWVWSPSHYVRTPRGYVFCTGHWDYALEDRGVLFAPVHFPPAVYARAGYTYSPSVVLDLGVLSVNLFAYPRYSHYYFGDYYDTAYVQIGIFPRFDGDRLHTWYDPIYEYDRWHHRAEPRWEEQERHGYDVRRADVNLRPARTYRDMETRVAKLPEAQQRNVRFAQPLTTVVTSKTTTMKFEQINTVTRQKIATQATTVHTLRDQRTQWEAKAPDPKRGQLPAARTKAEIAPKQPATPAIEHKQPVATPTERVQSVTPTIEHKQPVATPAERIHPVTPATEHKQPVVPTPAAKAEPVPAAQVHAVPPDRVKIQPTHVVGKPAVSGATGKAPPARPADEHKAPAEVKAPRPTPAPAAEHKAPAEVKDPHPAPAPAAERRAPAAAEAKDARKDKDEGKTK